MQLTRHVSLVRVDTAHVVAELIRHPAEPAPGEVFQDSMHIVALQHRQPSYTCQGRYRVPNLRPDFQNIGRLLVVPATIPLEVNTSDRPDEVVRCMFTQEVLEEYGGDSHVFDGNVLSSLLNFRHRGIEDILNILGNELRAPGFASNALVESLGMTLLIQFARYVRDFPKGDIVYRGGLSRRHMRIITEAVEGGTQCPSLSELSDLAGVSLRHLTRSFKESTGMTVYAYIEQVRFEKARALLADTDLLVKDIAYQLGFSCASSLSVAFRKLAGETPQDYRRRVGRAEKNTSTH